MSDRLLFVVLTRPSNQKKKGMAQSLARQICENLIGENAFG